MISYHLDCQKTMLLVKTELESKGLRVWMDVGKRTEDTLETMARAVEKSSVVLIAMSRGYQSSPNCLSGSSISTTEFKQRRRQRQLQRHDTDQLINIIFYASTYIYICKTTWIQYLVYIYITTRVLIGQKPTRSKVVVAVNSENYCFCFRKAIDRFFYGFTCVRNPLGCWENSKKACKYSKSR